jgi:superfamily II DNA or RNA helicase
MATRSDRFIASCASWDEFYRRTRALSNDDKGRVFERFVQLYLQTEPEYRLKLSDVWLAREVPPDVRKAIRLPTRDEGIDLVARTRGDEFWSIQAKCFYQDGAISRRTLGTFQATTWNTCRNISLAVIAHVSPKPISKQELYNDTIQLGVDRFRAADWSLIQRRAKNKNDAARPKVRAPRRHQKRAIAAAVDHFLVNKAARGRMIMPCGTGKSLAALWIAQALKANTIAVAVPNLNLITQGVRDWTQELVAQGQRPDWLCVCSDDSDFNNDEIIRTIYDAGLPALTDPKKLAKQLRQSSKFKIVFTTYQSSDVLAEAARRARVKFDLVIFDEAHRTTGPRSKTFATLLHDREMKGRHRLFMTATERVIMNGGDDVFSMDDNEADYGKRFFGMSFRQAIDAKLICDYKILTVSVTEAQIRKLITKNRFLNLGRKPLAEAEARRVATGIAVKRAVEKYRVKRGLVFNATILGSKRFCEQQDILAPKMANFHVSSEMTALERDNELTEFMKSTKPAMMSNARCLGEGFDMMSNARRLGNGVSVPEVDCVVFADPKHSRVDIVQATGRAMRRGKGKKRGYIIVPIVVPESMDVDEYADSTAFASIMRVLRALSFYDKRIVEELATLQYGRVPRRGKKLEFIGKVPRSLKMSLGKFERAIKLKMWENIARVNWRPFEEARKFARKLGLESKEQWIACELPNDIPRTPEKVYADSGWNGYGDFLGIKLRIGGWRSFEEARELARKLGLRSLEQWKVFARSGKRPNDIPMAPDNVYFNIGWKGWADFLGTRNRKGGWRSSEEASKFAGKLHLRSQKEWFAWVRLGKLPDDLPANPQAVYANNGWKGWGYFLGTNRAARPRGNWLSFKEARYVARKLRLQSMQEWLALVRSSKRPKNIPANPSWTYKNAGWISWADFLGINRDWRPFRKARAFARKLGLTSAKEWQAWARSDKKPNDIPATPDQTYAKSGWTNWRDFLGTVGRPRPRRDWMPFLKAHAFARKLGFKSVIEWQAWARSKRRPKNIPSDPSSIYANSGWKNWPDFLSF